MTKADKTRLIGPLLGVLIGVFTPHWFAFLSIGFSTALVVRDLCPNFLHFVRCDEHGWEHWSESCAGGN